MNYAFRIKLKGSDQFSYLMIPSFCDRGVSPEPGVFIEADQIEAIQYQDLEVPTIMRRKMGELAWSDISLGEIGTLFEQQAEQRRLTS
jgi:hypothetical protein